MVLCRHLLDCCCCCCLAQIYPFLMGNAVLYNSIPALRYCALLARNAAVERRNMNRVSW